MRWVLAPVLGRSHHPAFDRVVVQILELLLQHLIADDRLRVRSFLPDLIFLRLVVGSIITWLIEEPFPAFARQLLDDLSRGKALRSRRTPERSGAARIAWKWLSRMTQP